MPAVEEERVLVSIKQTEMKSRKPNRLKNIDIGNYHHRNSWKIINTGYYKNTMCIYKMSNTFIILKLHFL